MFKCSECEDKYEQLPDLLSHIEEEHGDCIPKNQSVEQYYYMVKTGKTHGSCVVCKNKTGWNEVTKKYHRFCKNPKCKEKYRETFKKRMIGTYGKVTLLDDPEHQRKMLANRSISGKYTWSDGVEFIYTGSYEHDFLRFLDVFMGFDSSDVMAPSPHTYYYKYKGDRKFYMPDFFIPSLNLEIEIKDGGDNANNHHKIQAVDKVKEKLKDEVLLSQKEFSYIKVVNKQYDNFFDCLLAMKESIAKDGKIHQVFDLADSKGLVVKGPVIESSIADYADFDEDFVIEMIQGIDSIDVLDSVLEGALLREDFKEVVNNYREFMMIDTDDLLRDIDDYNKEHDHSDKDYSVSDYLKSAGVINTPVRTPGFSSPHTGNLFLNVLENLTVDGCDPKVIKTIADEFQETLHCVADSDTIQRYEHDSKLMTYYLKLLAGKLDKQRLYISDVDKQFKNIVLEAALTIEGKDAYPVYVLLTHTGTALSNVIKNVTKNPYSHASISFDPSLNEMYSFGRKYKNNPLIGTFVREDIQAGLYGDVIEHADYSLFVTFVTKEQLEGMQERLRSFRESDTKYKYSFVGLINYKRGKESNSVDEFFCSQFVDYVLTAGRQYFDRHSSLVQPMDFAAHKDFYFVSKGKLKDYDPSAVDSKVEKISKKAHFEKQNGTDRIVYIGLTREDIETKNNIFTNPEKNKYIAAKNNLPELKEAITSGELPSNITHYTVVSLDELKKSANVMKSSKGYLVELPILTKIKNVNRLV